MSNPNFFIILLNRVDIKNKMWAALAANRFLCSESGPKIGVAYFWLLEKGVFKCDDL